MPDPSSLRRALAAATGTALAASTLILVPAAAHASPAGDGIVINEVYGGGGNSGAPLRNDFVELLNPTGTAIGLDGLSLEYRSAAGGSGGVVALEGVVEPGSHFLVQLAAGANTAAQPLPAADQSATINMSGSQGRVFLTETDGGFDSATEGDVAGAAGLVDMVAYGTTASFETAGAAGLGNATSASRAEGADTDDNSADLTAGQPTPTNAAGETVGGDEDPGEPEGPAEDMTIAEANGSAGARVAVEGVVTADYREGGFNGFTIQDPSGDPADAASDAIFVWGDRARAEIGQSVRVTGEVTSYEGLTEIVPDAVEELPADLGEVTPVTDWEAIADEEGRRAHLSELVLIDGFTVTDNYDANVYGSFGLAYGDEPLRQPTDVIDPLDTEAIAAAEADIAARSITLDDGRSTSFRSSTDVPLSYLTPESPVTVGAAVSLAEPFVLDYRYGGWNLQPTTPVTGADDRVEFGDVRAENAAPREVGGRIELATFNVLNYFPTTGEEFVESGLGTCSYYADRAGDPVTADRCEPNGPRGAADAENLERQETKLVNAISALGASIVSLEEIENSAHFGKDRDFAVAALVDALNAKDGDGEWAYVASPDALPAAEDVIRNAFIYRPAAVEPVGESHVLIDDPAFDNAREPLVQAFAPVGAAEDEAFLVATNHFKSKGSGVDDGTGQGNANPDRKAQAAALVAFAEERAAEAGIDAVLLAGDFNAYAAEEPVRIIEGAGYTNLNYALNGGEATYNYDGRDGSLDHVFANAAALERVTGVDVWQINAQEQVGFEYSRFNNNATLLYDESAFRASDHNPILVGLDEVPAEEEPIGEDPVGEDPVGEDPVGEEPAGDGTPGDEQTGAGARTGIGASAGADGDDGALAATGGEIAWGVAALAALLVAAGGGLASLRRRRV